MRPAPAVTAALLLAISACAPKPEDIANGDDPMKALAVSVRSTRYDRAYWSEQRRSQSAAWTQAVSYCEPRGTADFPNCEPVSENAAADRGNSRADSVLRAVGAAARQRSQ